MRISKRNNGNGYVMWLSAKDTYAWATKPGAVWPCSRLAGHRCMVEVERNGLCAVTLDGSHSLPFRFGRHEIKAIVTDYLPKGLRHLWPSTFSSPHSSPP